MLDVSFNALEGSIDNFLAPSLNRLVLERNLLTGNVPDALSRHPIAHGGHKLKEWFDFFEENGSESNVDVNSEDEINENSDVDGVDGENETIQRGRDVIDDFDGIEKDDPLLNKGRLHVTRNHSRFLISDYYEIIHCDK